MEEEKGISADEFVYTNMKMYMHSVIGLTFSSAVDGLCCVGRRILLASKGTVGTTDRLLSIIAETMKLHVAGDGSIKETMDNNTQTWRTHIPLLEYRGNMGSYSGDPAAHPRYLNDVKITNLAHDIFFKYTDMNVLPMVQLDVGNKEPRHLIPCIPAGLVSNNQAMAPGYRFLTIPISINSACNIVETFINVQDKNPNWNRRRQGIDPLIKHLIPDLPVPSLIRNFKDVYESYSNGNFRTPIVVDGIMDVTPNTIVIKTIPTGEIIHKQRQIEEDMRNSSSWFYKYFTTYDSSPEIVSMAEHTFTLKRGYDPFEVIDLVKKFYGFTQSVKLFPNWLNVQGERQEMSPVQILETWYNERYKAICNQLRIEQNYLINQIRRYTVLILVLNNLETIKNIFISAESPEDAVNKVVEILPELTKFQARYIFEMNFKNLTKSGRKDFEDKIQSLKEKLSACNEDILNVNKVLIRHAEWIKKTHGKNSSNYSFKGYEMDDSERTSKIPNFGFICKIRETGYIQCFTIQDIERVCRNHEITNVKIIRNNDTCKKYYVTLDNKIVDDTSMDFPQIFGGRCLTLAAEPVKNTVVLDTTNKTIYSIPRLVYQHDKVIGKDILFVGDNFYTVNESGVCVKSTIADLPIRKNLLSGGNQTDIRFILNSHDHDMYVIYCLKAQPNTVVFEKVTTEKKMGLIAGAELLYCGTEPNPVVSITNGAFNKTLLKHLFVYNVYNIFKHSDRIQIHLSTLKSSMDGIKIQSNAISKYIKEIVIGE